MIGEWARTCCFCAQDGHCALASSTELTTSGMRLDLCERHLEAVAEWRARLGIGFQQPLPTPGALGSVLRAMDKARKEAAQTYH